MTALLLLISSAALADDGSRWESEADDDTITILGSALYPRIDDTPMTTSEASLRDVEAAYEAADVLCVLKQYANEEGEQQNEETDLCEPGEGPTDAEIVALVSSEFKVLPLAAPVITTQPEGDWALVNMDFIVFTQADRQVLGTTILGVPVSVRATPVHYSWDFGDGSPPLATTDPGVPYPNQTVSHVYTGVSEGVAVSLTTSWQGELQINGTGAWLPIAGFATTVSSAAPVEIVAMDVNLVP